MSIKLPSYVNLSQTGELTRRALRARELLTCCYVCPRGCNVNRMEGETGVCLSGYLPSVSSYCPHFGEEPAISGRRGSGTIFFSRCNLHCVFCQNHQISHPSRSEAHPDISFEDLANIMIELQKKGCHNINLVSPGHFVPQIVISLEIAVRMGLNIPIVYNSNGYDTVESLRLLEGIIDIYLPDMKYGNDTSALMYSSAPEYLKYAKAALIEMKRQVGVLKLDSHGIARRGLIIRHLVLPNGLADSNEILEFVANELGTGTYMSIMSQYFPTYRAADHMLLTRPVSMTEYTRVLEYRYGLGLDKGWIQDHSSVHAYRPDFDKNEPFDNKYSH